MSDNSSFDKSIQLAHAIWPNLVILAERGSTISYQDLGGLYGISGPGLIGMGKFLDPIKHYCLQHNLPQLNALVVKKDTNVPGAGAEAGQSDIDAVHAFNWRSRTPITPSEQDLFDAMQK
jgi:hypothetical protein